MREGGREGGREGEDKEESLVCNGTVKGVDFNSLSKNTHDLKHSLTHISPPL